MVSASGIWSSQVKCGLSNKECRLWSLKVTSRGSGCCFNYLIRPNNSCGVVPYSQQYVFLRSLSLSSFCTPLGYMRVCGGSTAYLVSVQGSLLPLGSFRTLKKLFCGNQSHDGVRGNCVGCLQSSCPALPIIAFSFLKEMRGTCCFPGST